MVRSHHISHVERGATSPPLGIQGGPGGGKKRGAGGSRSAIDDRSAHHSCVCPWSMAKPAAMMIESRQSRAGVVGPPRTVAHGIDRHRLPMPGRGAIRGRQAVMIVRSGGARPGWAGITWRCMIMPQRGQVASDGTRSGFGSGTASLARSQRRCQASCARICWSTARRRGLNSP